MGITGSDFDEEYDEEYNPVENNNRYLEPYFIRDCKTNSKKRVYWYLRPGYEFDKNFGLEIACQVASYKIVKYILKHGANHYNAGIWCVCLRTDAHQRYRILKLLLQKNVNLNNILEAPDSNHQIILLIEKRQKFPKLKLKRFSIQSILIKVLKQELKNYVNY
jgi:hypothetical protein